VKLPGFDSERETTEVVTHVANARTVEELVRGMECIVRHTRQIKPDLYTVKLPSDRPHPFEPSGDDDGLLFP